MLPARALLVLLVAGMSLPRAWAVRDSHVALALSPDDEHQKKGASSFVQPRATLAGATREADEGAGEPFDCQAGYDNWQAGWSDAKKDWCCANKQMGCPPPASGGEEDEAVSDVDAPPTDSVDDKAQVVPPTAGVDDNVDVEPPTDSVDGPGVDPPPPAGDDDQVVVTTDDGDETEDLAPVPLRREGRDVVICRGVGDLSNELMRQMGAAWARFAKKGVITATSTLLYYVDEQGHLKPFKGKDKDTQEEIYYPSAIQKYVTDVVRGPDGRRIRNLPHVFCDTTLPGRQACSMPWGVNAAMKRRDAFFAESIALAHKWGHDGYALDFEGTWGNASDSDVTEFLGEWKQALATGKSPDGLPLELHVWTAAHIQEGNLSDKVDSIVDMSSYRFSKFEPSGPSTPSSSEDEDDDGDVRASREQREDPSALEPHLEHFCHELEGGSCSAGLISYDLPNCHLKCDDLLELAQYGRERDMRGIWLWTGGLVSKDWEPGLANFASHPLLQQESTQAACQALSLAQTPNHSAPDCTFDGQYYCDGSAKPPPTPAPPPGPPESDPGDDDDESDDKESDESADTGGDTDGDTDGDSSAGSDQQSAKKSDVHINVNVNVVKHVGVDLLGRQLATASVGPGADQPSALARPPGMLKVLFPGGNHS